MTQPFNPTAWCIRWGVPYAALQELQQSIGVADIGSTEGRSETAVSNDVRLEASRKGMRLFRNNVGVLTDDTGRPVRYGLANDSAAVNKVCKSADLIGIDPTPITAAMIGEPRGRFVSAECKPEGWHYTGTPREQAQQAWAMLITSLGGRALFVNRAGLL